MYIEIWREVKLEIELETEMEMETIRLGYIDTEREETRDKTDEP